VSGALGGDALAVGGRGTDHIAYLVRATRQRNAGRLLVDQNVEGPTFQVPVGVLLCHEVSGHA
jgi:hypothetical protein